MKIIFDSEEEKIYFFDRLDKADVCPQDLYLTTREIDCYKFPKCKECLKRYIPHEVVQK